MKFFNLPPQNPFTGGKHSLFNRVVKQFPPIIKDQFTPQHIPRTIKYVTWVSPALIYPPLTYFATKDKQSEGKDNLIRQYSRYTIGPCIQLGVDALLMRLFTKRFPKAFEHVSQAEVTSFLIAYVCYTAWETYGVQRAVELERKKRSH
jgi:hypothetical protein